MDKYLENDPELEAQMNELREKNEQLKPENRVITLEAQLKAKEAEIEKLREGLRELNKDDWIRFHAYYGFLIDDLLKEGE